ncbi:MAG: ATP-binding cassette domain-containing protein [Calditrichaeota bacterium]|nr:MAG: ATP-binding cassette domain-containing protein [Calditrichota bacterium]
MPLLKVEHVSKSFNDHIAVDDISFTLDAGVVYGILGPNGAGKSTTIRMIMNILVPDKGRINLFGASMNEDLKNRIGYLPEERGLYPKMKVADVLTFLGELHNLTPADARQRAMRWLERLDLAGHAHQKVDTLSKGMQQKVQIIGSLLHDPSLLILDEPFSGLDPVNTNLIKDIMLELKNEGRAIMLSTHMMETAEKLCDRILMINHGHLVLEGPLDKLQQRYGSQSLQVEYNGDAAFVRELPMIQKADIYANYMEIRLKDAAMRKEFLKIIADKLDIISFKSQKSSLNEIFIREAGETHA